MIFKKTAIAASLSLLVATGAIAETKAADIPAAFNSTGKPMTGEDLDRLEQEKIRLQNLFSYREMQAEIAAMENKINNAGSNGNQGGSQDPSDDSLLQTKVDELSSQNQLLQQAVSALRSRLEYYEDSNNPSVMEHHVFVTRTFTVKGVKKAKIFYNNYWNTLIEGDEIAHGVTIAEINGSGIVIQKPGGETHQILKTTHERAVIETFGLKNEDAESPDDPSNGYLVPTI